ncbi:hypothetical protein ACT2FY_30355 [Paraburkholderia fungorum]|uniref:hypothetical protein n=1 Tax=Paraburkholderia fungorum TaxID=134537 RepID=UPI00402B7893
MRFELSGWFWITIGISTSSLLYLNTLSIAGANYNVCVHSTSVPHNVACSITSKDSLLAALTALARQRAASEQIEGVKSRLRKSQLLGLLNYS